MAKGFVYILLNPSFHDQVKIGRTTDVSERRAKRLSKSTGVPTPFIVVYDELVSDCEEVERRLHQRFAGYRVSAKREFFRVPIREAINALQEEADHFQIGASASPEKCEILFKLKQRFATFLKPDIVSVAIVQYTDICYLEITRRTNPYYRDEIVERIDLRIIRSGSKLLFPPTRPVEENAALFAELDGYSLINITPLMTDEGAQTIASQFEAEQRRVGDY